ncbi:MAG: LPP20 family lipoprotein [Sphaerochaetaceae bacterium]|jgi:hypothetical protein
MKTKVAVVILTLILILSSCVSFRDKPTSGVIGLDGIAQPSWVYKNVSSKDKFYATGYGKLSDRQASIKRATLEAKNVIAEYIETSVKEVVTNYLSDAGTDGNREALDALEVVSVQVAEQSLVGVTTEEMWIDSDGGVWVLCSIPLENITRSFDPASQLISEGFGGSTAAQAANQKMREALQTHLGEFSLP